MHKKQMKNFNSISSMMISNEEEPFVLVKRFLRLYSTSVAVGYMEYTYISENRFIISGYEYEFPLSGWP